MAFTDESAGEQPPVREPEEETVAPAASEDSVPDLPALGNGALGSHRAPRLLRIRERLSPTLRGLLSALPFLALLAGWLWLTAGDEASARRISPTILPSPVEVAGSFGSLWNDSALMRNIVVSLARVLAGFAVAALIAVPLGIAMGSFSRVGATFSLLATVLAYLPIAALVPLTIAWWGTEEKQKVGFLAVATFAYLLPLVVRHVNAVDHQYVLSAYTQGATVWQVVVRVLVPIAMPDIVNAMRLCLGIGWTYIVLAEVISSGEGMGGVGNLISIFQRKGLVDRIYLTVAAIMLVGALLDRGCIAVSRRLFPYRAALEAE